MELYNSQIEPTFKCAQNFSIFLNKLLVPRIYLLKTLMFQENLPIDIQVKVRLVNEGEELCPFVSSQFQMQVSYTEQAVMYDFKYLIEFPIHMSSLPPTAQINIALEGYKFSKSANFSIFKECARLPVFRNGQQVISFDGISLYAELRPNQDIKIVHLQEEPTT